MLNSVESHLGLNVSKRGRWISKEQPGVTGCVSHDCLERGKLKPLGSFIQPNLTLRLFVFLVKKKNKNIKSQVQRGY